MNTAVVGILVSIAPQGYWIQEFYVILKEQS